MTKLKRCLKDKNGSYIVFITILLSGMMILISTIIYISGEKAVYSASDNLGRLWGRSILAEYDRELKDRYGIFAYQGNEALVAEKLNYYIDYSFGDKKYISYNVKKVSLSGYKITDAENFKSQIKEIVVSGTVPKINASGKSMDESDGEDDNRYIAAGWIISGLPSGGKKTLSSVQDLINIAKKGASVSDIVSGAALDTYIFKFYKDYMNERDLGETYLRNEIEYILTGNANDEKSKKSVYNSLFIYRNAMNLAYLYSCDEKREATLAAAELIAPGAGAFAVQLLLLESWAALEAKNDLELLLDSKSVPITKKDCNWALTLEAVIEELYDEDTDKGGEKKKYITPEKVEGLNYEEHLKILIALLPDEIKSLRMMDLMQINMKYLYSGSFLLDQCYTGLEFELEVNGKEHVFKELY